MVLKGPTQGAVPGPHNTVQHIYCTPPTTSVIKIHQVQLMYFVLYTHCFFTLYLCCLICWHFRTGTNSCFLRFLWLSMVFKNSHFQCFILVLTESNTNLSQSHPQLNACGEAKYRSYFPYFFSSTPGPLPSISFSHHANWQKLVPFALFVFLAETACSVYGTTSQSKLEVSACLSGFSRMHCNGNWNIYYETETRGSLNMCFDLLRHIYDHNGAMTWKVEKNTTWV